jgi:hypothetical protein
MRTRGRVANLEKWARVAPLNGTEYKLLLNYNEKPVLTRPQQMFYVGPNYLEVDLDVHSYAFLARKALWGYHDRIATVVWDNGFVIQVRLRAWSCVLFCLYRWLDNCLRASAYGMPACDAVQRLMHHRLTRLPCCPACCVSCCRGTPQMSCRSSCWAAVASTGATSGASLASTQPQQQAASAAHPAGAAACRCRLV